MKKLLLLGGLRYLIPVIKEARKLGYYTITCDYLPENIAHKYSHEYYNVSITDKTSVLELAKNLKIDGVMSFAVDPGVVTAAYVAENLNLPGCPLKSVEILQNKGLFRAFLEEHKFNVPRAKAFTDLSEAVAAISKFQYPVIVKPVDSAGSKGVSKVNELNDLNCAVNLAKLNSSSSCFIVEEFIDAQGYASDSDCFSLNGNLKIFTLNNQYFDDDSSNKFAPSAFSWPSGISYKNQEILRNELQRLIRLLELGTSLYNVEVRVGLNDKPYIMEVSPRGGGNRLSELVKYATGINLIQYAIQGAMGETFEVKEEVKYQGNWAELILYSMEEGQFSHIEIDPSVKAYLKEEDIWVQKGEKVYPFTAANYSIGTLIFNFENQEQVKNLIANRHTLIRISVY